MADENEKYLSSVKIGGDTYEIYAKSALSAGWVPATAIDGPIPASSITAVNETAISSVNITAVTAVQDSAISSVPWSAISALTATSSQSGNTSGLWTPSTTVDYVTEVVKESISNVYKFKGTCQVEDLPTSNNQNGDVWNLSNGGLINPTDASHSATVYTSDNVAWITADGGYWDKLAATDMDDKLDVTAFTAWSANTNGDSTFAGSAASANTAWVTMNVSGNEGQGGNTASADGYSLIQSALSGANASAWITDYETSGKPVWVTQTYLSGDGTDGSAIGLKPPASTIDSATTPTSSLATVGAITSYVETNYIGKNDIRVENSHQLVIDNTTT